MSGTDRAAVNSGDQPRPGLSWYAENLKTMFAPRSMAIVGASREIARIGGRPIHYSIGAGYEGTIYPINPKYEEVAGMRCYPDLESLPVTPDLCVVATPAEHVGGIVQRCAELGIGSVVVFSSGFSEVSESGRLEQLRLSDLARQSGMNVLGPNCLGALSYKSGMMATFSSHLQVDDVPAGNIGFVCQSGAFGTYFLSLARDRGMNFSHWVATGNEADVSVADCIAFMALDPDTEVIAGYVEGVRDGPRFREALEMARARGKPVVLMKTGRSEAGSRAAASHTASMAGNDAVFDAVFERHGAYRASDIDALLNITQACSYGAFPRGRRVCLLTMSGGVGIIMADRASEIGLELPEVPEETQEELKNRLSYAAVTNPVDFTGHVVNEPGLMEDFLEPILNAGDYDALLTFMGHTLLSEEIAGRTIPAYVRLAERSEIPFFLNGRTSPQFERVLRDNKQSLFENPSQAVDTLMAQARISEALANSAANGQRERASLEKHPGLQRAVDLVSAAWNSPQGERMSLGESDSRSVLAHAGVEVARGGRAQDEESAVATAAEIGFPVVVKVDSPDIGHKSDVGGVAIDLADEQQVREAVRSILRNVEARSPDARVEGVVVEEMIDDGLQVILGAYRDPTFGPVVLFGMGGVYAEVLGDRRLAIAPLSMEDSQRLISETAAGRVLSSPRSARPYDLPALAKAVQGLSTAMVVEPRLSEVDVNPLLVRAEGQGVKALDALVVLEDARRSSDG